MKPSEITDAGCETYQAVGLTPKPKEDDDGYAECWESVDTGLFGLRSACRMEMGLSHGRAGSLRERAGCGAVYAAGRDGFDMSGPFCSREKRGLFLPGHFVTTSGFVKCGRLWPPLS